MKDYSILLDIEGGGYSARLKYLLLSNKPLLIVNRPYKEFFFKNLQEYVHYIPVKRDLSDLIDKTKWILHLWIFKMSIYLLQSFKLRHNGHNGLCSLFPNPSFVMLYQQSLQTL